LPWPSSSCTGSYFGRLGDPTHVGQWREDFLRTLEFATSAHARAINVLAGGRIRSLTRSAQLDCILDNLVWALDRIPDGGPTLLLEPLNGADRGSPLLRNILDVCTIRASLGDPANLLLLFDAYHLFHEEHDLVASLKESAPMIGHVQIADHPGRGEPGTGEIDFVSMLASLHESGYGGWVGLEYFPTAGVEPPFAWLAAHAVPGCGSSGGSTVLAGER
jgi:hydroxypyruvate isomerase